MGEKELIELLKSKKENEWTTKEEICFKLGEYFKPNYDKSVHDICIDIWKAKDNINNNAEVYGTIIITNTKGDLKIPTKEEANKYLNHKMKICLKSLKRYWNMTKAMGIINQGTFEDKVLEIVRDGKEN